MKKTKTRVIVLCVFLAAAAIGLVLLLVPFFREKTTNNESQYVDVGIHHVLFISSYSENFETVDLQKEGIQDCFREENRNNNADIDLDIYYMDMKKFDTTENENNFYESLKYKLEHTGDQYDAVLLGDDAALMFAQKHQEELFEGIPIVFFGINDLDRAKQAAKNPYMTGSMEKFYIEDTLEVALKLQPDATKLVLLYDDSLPGRGDYSQATEAVKSFPQLTFVGISSSDYSLEDYTYALESITRDSIVLFMDALDDIEGNEYSIADRVDLFSKHIHVPVYRVSIGGIGDGFIGGKIVDYEKIGRQAAETVIRILQGTDIADIPLDTTDYGEFVFDSSVLREYGISSAYLPYGIRLVNSGKDKENSVRYYRVILLFLVVLLSIASIVLLVQLLHQRTHYVQQLENKTEELADMTGRLERSLMEKTAIMSNVSHEIRTPINAISGLAHLGGKSATDADTRQYFDKIQQSSEYLTGIVNDILDFNKMEDGSLKVIPSPTSMHDIRSHLDSIVEPMAAAKNIHYVNDRSGMQNYYVLCDRMRLEQILLNLVSNAIKFTPNGGHVTVKANQEKKETETTFICTVTDDGCGMSADFLEHAFEPYTQENRLPELYGTGTGLGLYISRALAHMMGGELTAVSKEGMGTTFTFRATFPNCSKEEIEKMRQQSQMAEQLDTLAGHRVLLVDDNELNREVAVGILEAAGTKTETAANGQDALDMYCEHPENYYDIILMDIRMPVMDGIEATKRIRGSGRKDALSIPIIAMSADAFDETIRDGRDAGMNEFLSKPLNVKGVIPTIKKYIDQ